MNRRQSTKRNETYENSPPNSKCARKRRYETSDTDLQSRLASLQSRILVDLIENDSDNDTKVKAHLFDDKRVYYGPWTDNAPNGYGVMIYTDGSNYLGHFKNGEPKGTGIYVPSKGGDVLFCDNSVEGGSCPMSDIVNKYTKEGDIYYGEWLDGKQNGNGMTLTACGFFCWGTYKGGKLDGAGFQHNCATQSYERYFYVGRMEDGKANGHGRSVWENGETFIGQWRNGKMHGDGECTWSTGSRYVGQFRNDVREGKGTFTYASGDEFVGEYKANRQNGHGKITLANSDKYISAEGTWEDGYFKNGVIKYTGGNEYECPLTGTQDKWEWEGREKMRICGGGVIEGVWKDNTFVDESKSPTEMQCIICCENTVDASISHGDSEHVICCMSCANDLKRRGNTCPKCRKPIDNIRKVYF